MNPAGVTVARRLWSSDGTLLHRGFIRSLTTGWMARRHERVRLPTRDGLYSPLGDSIKGNIMHREEKAEGAKPAPSFPLGRDAALSPVFSAFLGRSMHAGRQPVVRPVTANAFAEAYILPYGIG